MKTSEIFISMREREIERDHRINISGSPCVFTPKLPNVQFLEKDYFIPDKRDNFSGS